MACMLSPNCPLIFCVFFLELCRNHPNHRPTNSTEHARKMSDTQQDWNFTFSWSKKVLCGVSHGLPLFAPVLPLSSVFLILQCADPHLHALLPHRGDTSFRERAEREGVIQRNRRPRRYIWSVHVVLWRPLRYRAHGVRLRDLLRVLLRYLEGTELEIVRDLENFWTNQGF